MSGGDGGSVDTAVKYVCIDTSIFRSFGFDLSSGPLEALQGLCRSGAVKLLITDVIRRECERHIGVMITDAIEIIEAKRTKLKILSLGKNAPLPGVSEIDALCGSSSAVEAFNKFLEECQAVEIGTSSLSFGDLADLYFSRKPPFSDAKKSEFPDAATLLAVDRYATGLLSRVYALSLDEDWKSYCNQENLLLWGASLSDFVSAHASRPINPLIAKSILDQQDTIFQKMVESMDDYTFTIEMDDYDIYNVNLDIDEVYSTVILQSSDNDVIAEVGFSFTVSVDFAYIYWPDEGPSRWRQTTIERIANSLAEVRGKWNAFDECLEITSVTHTSPRNILLSMDDPRG